MSEPANSPEQYQRPLPPPPVRVQPLGYQTPGASARGPAYAGPPATSDDCSIAMLAHVLGILTGFVGPLVIWLVKKETSPFVADQSVEALNFQLTLLIGYGIAGVTTFVCIGFLLIPAVLVLQIVWGIMAALAASRGEPYRYPLNIRFIQ